MVPEPPVRDDARAGRKPSVIVTPPGRCGEQFVTTTHTRAKCFYVSMAALCMLVAFAGFVPTYWRPVVGGTFVGPPILHIHGLLFSSWTVFCLIQAALAASGRMARHRAMGLVGISIATSMVIMGWLTALISLKHSIAVGNGDSARPFAIVSFLGMPLFAGLFIAAIANVRRPEVHKRLMLVATVGLLQAPVGRVFRLFLAPAAVLALPKWAAPQPPVASTIGPAIVCDLIILIGMLHDWRTRRRPHPAYLIGGGITVAVQVLAVPLSATTAWQTIVDRILSLAG
jgi:hypothetical protein